MSQETSIHGHLYNFKLSLPDPRDIPADAGDLLIKPEVDPRGLMQDPYDQGQLGSCDPNAWEGAAEYDRILDNDNEGTGSRLFIYYNGRVQEGTVDEDSGLMGRTGAEVLRKYGAPLESEETYDISKFTEKPSDQDYKDAAKTRINKYVHPGMNRTEEARKNVFKRLLSNDQTIPFGFVVYQQFESDKCLEDGIVAMPKPGKERSLGGHEVVLCGYLPEHPEYGLCRNSWGKDVMIGGYFLMPWEYICSNSYASEWRSIYRPIAE